MARKPKATPKPKKKRGKNAGAEPTTAESELEAQVLAEAREAAKSDPVLAGELIKAFEQWETIRSFGVDERKRTAELVVARLAAFKEAMEVGHQNANDQILKLNVVEQRWQDLEDARSERKEIGSAVRDQMKNAHQKLKDLINERNNPQISMFGRDDRTPDIDHPPQPEEDEPEPSNDPIDDEADSREADVDGTRFGEPDEEHSVFGHP